MSDNASEAPALRSAAWHDLAIVMAIAIAALLISAHFELTEAFFALTRRWEAYQLDEIPVAVLALAVALAWLAWRRYRQARRELIARQQAERRLADVLTHNWQLSRERLRIQELERKHIARELHDQLGQYLNAIKLDAVSLLQDEPAPAPAVMESAQAIIRSVDHVHAAVSDLIGRLRPVGLDELGLMAAIEHCVDHWRARAPRTQIELSVQGNVDDVAEGVALTVFRLIQEGLTNVVQHAQAQRARIALQRRALDGGVDQLFLSVSDDGRGMDVRQRSTRFGLSGMRERVELAGGEFSLVSAPGQGVHIEARLPAVALSL